MDKKRKIFWAVFLAILAIGIFLRAYHFSDWLHFELDQSRDAKIIDLAIKEGPFNLPLLGPKAAGTFLRLGPAFYYFKYLSALVFGNTPSGVAVIVMIFGILAIPVFYLFSRRYFSREISLGLMFLFAVSLFLVVYSRFSWNPNPLPLFTLLTFYFLLRAVDETDKNKDKWFLAFAASLAIATQMHFLAFVAVPAISFIFLVIKRPKIKWKYWAGAIAIVAFLYLPAVINDVETGGDNIGQFLGVAQGKSEKSSHNMVEKAIKSYSENALGYATVLFGTEKRALPKVTFDKSKFFKPTCDKDCESELNMGVFSLLFFTLSIMLLVLSIIKEKDLQKKDFLLITAVWFFVVLGLYVPISYDISPRFFLLVSATPFIFLGIMLKHLEIALKNKKISLIAIFIIILLIGGNNLWKIKQRFWQLGNASSKSFDIETDRILKEKTRVTLVQQENIISYIISKQKKNGFPVYLNSDPEYRRSFLFHLDQNNIPRDDLRNATNSGKVYEHGNYFLVYPTLSNYKKDLEKYSKNFDLAGQKEFGTLALFELKPKPEAVNATDQDFSQDGSKGSSTAPKRFKWEEIFNDSAKDENSADN